VPRLYRFEERLVNGFGCADFPDSGPPRRRFDGLWADSSSCRQLASQPEQIAEGKEREELVMSQSFRFRGGPEYVRIVSELVKGG
jgi:hypothetical protein